MSGSVPCSRTREWIRRLAHEPTVVPSVPFGTVVPWPGSFASPRCSPRRGLLASPAHAAGRARAGRTRTEIATLRARRPLRAWGVTSRVGVTLTAHQGSARVEIRDHLALEPDGGGDLAPPATPVAGPQDGPATRASSPVPPATAEDGVDADREDHQPRLGARLRSSGEPEA